PPPPPASSASPGPISPPFLSRPPLHKNLRPPPSPPIEETPAMTTVTRRHFLQTTGALAATGLAVPDALAAPAGEAKNKPLKFRLGIVTYNIAAQWDIPTILKVCKSVGLSPVELRTTHKHGVE